MTSTLAELHPWVAAPFIASAPMAGRAGAELAVAVSGAQGLGFVGSSKDMQFLDRQLARAKVLLEVSGSDAVTASGCLKVGAGLLLFHTNVEDAIAIAAKHKPDALWLSFPRDLSDYAEWVQALRRASPASRIWIQTGSVHTAVEIAEKASPDVIVMQGTDSGGHGFERGASVISLIPETADALDEAGHGGIPLLAAGGIVEGRGAAAAIVLGAQGVVLGTRFLGSNEVMQPEPGYQKSILAMRDGGQSTVRSSVFDDLRPAQKWPVGINGRSLANASWRDAESGMPIEENLRRLADAVKDEGSGFMAEDKRVTVWAGTGVGLVRKIQPAAEIVREVREGAIARLSRYAQRA